MTKESWFNLAEHEIFLFSKTDYLWHPHSLLYNGYHEVSPQVTVAKV
jgi:hypothetical protein